MKLSSGINLLSSRNIEKDLSKKITLANTSDKTIDNKVLSKAFAHASDPIFFTNGNTQQAFNPDIRYRSNFAFSPMTGINYRNDLFMFAENNEVKKAVQIVGNETVIIDTNISKYPVYPKINMTLVDEDKQQIATAIQDYLDKVFYPKLYQWYGFKDDGLIDTVKEFLITGKLAYEIIYDSIKHPKDIIGILPIDPSTLQKFKANGQVWYIQRAVIGEQGIQERILHENQVILCEWNKYDFGYISYVDKLRRSFNIMRSMQTSKILWFAAKSQVRMHIKLALGDVTRPEAITKLTEAKNQYINNFTFDDDGIVKFNNSPNNNGYREFFTAETAQSGSPEIEEINANGPDLSETESLSYWAKLFWSDTEIPVDRIDPNASETWGFTDVNSLRKIEVNFAKFINGIRKMLNSLFDKLIRIQLTLKEIEIGIDLSLLDTIKIEWVAFNEYDKLAELEVLNKKVELAQNMANFGEYTDSEGNPRKAIPLLWITETFLDFTQEQLNSMERARVRENIMLGFNADGTNPNNEEDEGFDDEGGFEDDEGFDDEDEGFDDEGGFEDEESFDEGEEQPISDETVQEPEIVTLVKTGQIDEEELGLLIDNGELSPEDIEALKAAGLYPDNETEQDIADADDDVDW